MHIFMFKVAESKKHFIYTSQPFIGYYGLKSQMHYAKYASKLQWIFGSDIVLFVLTGKTKNEWHKNKQKINIQSLFSTKYLSQTCYFYATKLYEQKEGGENKL